jgi:hypothetical protein
VIHAHIVQSLRREFASRTQAEVFRRFQLQQAEERQRREREEDLSKETSDLIDVAVTMATASQIRALEVDIDTYDAATVAALQENEEQMRDVRGELDEMLSKAYVLPDGRRVFKTEDGLRVFDEHGKEVSPDLIDPHEIADHLPRWERYKLKLDRYSALQNERADLIDYQDKLDAARERLHHGDMTQREYDDLRQDLVNDMPEAVRRQIPELANTEPEAKQQAASAGNDLGISDDMIATRAPQAPAPGG